MFSVQTTLLIYLSSVLIVMLTMRGMGWKPSTWGKSGWMFAMMPLLNTTISLVVIIEEVWHLLVKFWKFMTNERCADSSATFVTERDFRNRHIKCKCGKDKPLQMIKHAKEWRCIYCGQVFKPAK